MTDYKKVFLQRGIPFEMKLPQAAPLNYGSLTREQFDAKMEKGMSDVKAGRVYSVDIIEAEIRGYNIFDDFAEVGEIVDVGGFANTGEKYSGD